VSPRLPILLVLFAIALPLKSTPASWKEDVYDPRKPFNSAFGEMLNFEKASIETNLRGFVAVGDSSPGYRAQKSNPPHPPTEWGMNLNVALCEDTTKNSDVVEIKRGVVHRTISILSPVKNDPSAPSMEIEWTYGSKVKPAVIQAIEGCIVRLKKSAREKPVPPKNDPLITMWIVYFILALFVVVLILSLRNGVAYGMGFNQKKSENPVMYWFQIIVYTGIIGWLICWLLLNR